MAEPAVPKTPISVPELATRAATYGALALVGSSLLVTLLWFNDAQTKRVEHISAELVDIRRELGGLRIDGQRDTQALRGELNVLRVEFVEFRAETRAEFKALRVELDSIHTDLAEIKALLKARR
jgi:hypothetical protein